MASGLGGAIWTFGAMMNAGANDGHQLADSAPGASACASEMDAGASFRDAHKLNFLKLWPAKRAAETAPIPVYSFKIGTFPSLLRSYQTVAAIRASQLAWSQVGSAICFGGTRILISEKRKRLDVAPLLLLICILSMNETVAWAQDGKQVSSQAPSDAQMNSQFLASYEGQTVTAINVAGRPELTTAQFSSLFAQHTGEPFSEDKVEKTVEALKASGKFQDVELRVEPQANGVRVVFILDPAVYFGIFEFPGAERLSYTRLVQVSNFTAQSPYSAEDVEQDRQSLLTFLRQQGYFQAEVQTETKVDEPAALANIVFHVTLKQRAKFGDLVIADAQADQVPALTSALHGLGARLHGASVRPGKTYHHSTLIRATAYLQNQLVKRGFLSAQVKLTGAEYHADSSRADIHFDVTPGPLTHVEIAGAHLFSWTRKSLLPVYQGIGVDDESVQEGRQALVSYFEAKGYFDVAVDAKLTQQNNAETVLYQISKQKKHKVSDVSISGNSQISSSELTPHLSVEKAHLFSPGKFSDKLVRDSAKALQTVYQSEGYSSAQVASSVHKIEGNVAVAFQVKEGPRDIVSSLRIEGDDTFPPSRFAPAGLKLGEGKPYSQALVQSDRATIVANYLKAGYLNSSFHQTATVVSKEDPHHINVVYQIHEGPQVFTGNIITLGRMQTKQRLIDQDVATIQPSKPLTETELLTGESKLYDHTGVFDWAEVDPKRQITTQPNEDVVVKVHEGQRNQITYGFGFEVIDRGGSVPSGTVAVPGIPPVGLPTGFKTSETTFYGPRGTFQYTRNNVFGKGDTLSFTGFAGRLDQRGAAYFIAPNIFWSRWKATSSISAETNEQNPIFSSQEELGSFQIQRNLKDSKDTTLFLRYGYSDTNLIALLIDQLVSPADRHVRLSTLAANVTRDSRDNPLDEHKGLLQSIELDFNTTKLGSSVDFTKLNGQFAYFKTVSHNIVLANSVRIGLAQPFAGSRVPISEAFFTGGGNTLRGFPLEGAGPQRQVLVCSAGQTAPDCPKIQVPAGGNELLLINSEARIPLPFKKGLSIVPFYDGGSVFPRVGFHEFGSLYSNNVGLGLRYATPVGPVRVDIGHNLNPVPGINSTQYFISIGQAF